jgi:hypothetical protein
MTGAPFVLTVVARMLKEGNALVLRPSLTRIRMLLHVPADRGVPVSFPVFEPKLAQRGLLLM